ncbi:MAG: hypothetical protein EAS52_21715 [Parapedobacter sp.]|nr:MAG: hypothetical protein EAS52_21715 [Parapedobacter sp.]
MDFLDKGFTYRAKVFKDGASASYDTDPYPVAIEELDVTSTTTLDLQLAAGGGTAIIFSRL